MIRIVELNPNDAEMVASEIVSAGGSATTHRCDVTGQAEVVPAFQEIAKQGRTDILVNNAGIAHIGDVEATRETEFDRSGK